MISACLAPVAALADGPRTGLSPYAGPVDPEIHWTFYAESSFYGAPVVAEDGTIYAACTDKALYAIEPNGDMKWMFEAEDSLFSAPALMPEGGVAIADLEGNVYGVDAEGLESWRFEVRTSNEKRIIAPLLIDAEGQCYVPSWNQSLYAIRPNGGQRWSANIGGKLSSGAVLDAEGYIYVCSNDGGNLVVEKYSSGSRSKRGEFRETLTTGQNRVVSTPAVDAERNQLYVGASRKTDGALYGIDLDDMSRAFRVRLDKAVYSSPAIGPDGTVYAGCLDGSLYAVDPDTGDIKWSFSIRPADLEADPSYYGPPYIMGSPTVDKNGIVYFGDTSGALYAVTSEGVEQWRLQLSDANLVAAPVITADGVLLVAGYDSVLYAVGESAPVPDWSIHP